MFFDKEDIEIDEDVNIDEIPEELQLEDKDEDEFSDLDIVDDDEEIDEDDEEEEEGKISEVLNRFKKKKTNHHTSNEEFRPGKGEALRLQREYESGVLDKKSVTSEQLDKIIELYEEQIHELTLKIEKKRRGNSK